MAQIIGITGGIGSGKSMISRILQNHGYKVYDSDSEAKRIMQKNESVIRQIKDTFGEETYNPDGSLDNQRIAKLVFDNPAELTKLNNIVHPAVIEDAVSWAAGQSDTYVFLESAILFESGLNKICDKTISITAPIDIRIRRAMYRRTPHTLADIQNRIKNQLTDEERTRLSDFTIVNDRTKDYAKKQIEEILLNLGVHQQTDDLLRLFQSKK